MILDELRAFAGAILGMLDAAFPFEHGPALIVIAGELGKNALEVDLSIADRTEAPGALEPRRVAGIDALPSRRIELGVLHVEHLDPLVKDIDVFEIVQLLQHEVAGVE